MADALVVTMPNRFLRFVAVGVVNTGVGYAIYAAGLLAGLPPQAALVVQFVLGALWNYGMHARLVFAHRGLRRLPAYVGAYLLLWAVNGLALQGLLEAGVGPLAAQLLLLAPMVVLSFLLVSRVLSSRGGR
ncbi:GtrA family protein [Paracoccus benzoatiresistens]|uniref:GtrA family protein n=1 Tax=Paracoccus benzoatiresistens TaxID=2997341 RepID=A0ABT4J0J9_9RHOB|nr:GtrA family protein [Paracoccus sp. EF6]MCZ0960645.1 GtrA family protein [Paracoccus sp. EF6]